MAFSWKILNLHSSDNGKFASFRHSLLLYVVWTAIYNTRCTQGDTRHTRHRTMSEKETLQRNMLWRWICLLAGWLAQARKHGIFGRCFTILFEQCDHWSFSFYCDYSILIVCMCRWTAQHWSNVSNRSVYTVQCTSVQVVWTHNTKKGTRKHSQLYYYVN